VRRDEEARVLRMHNLRGVRAAIAVVLATASLLGGCVHDPPPVYGGSPPVALAARGRQLAVVGDLQMTSWFVRFLMRREFNRDEQAVLMADLAARRGDLAALVVVGDLVYAGRSERHWRHFDAVVGPIAAEVPILPAIGNHDYPCRLVHWCTQASISKPMLERFPWFAPGRPYEVAFGDVLLVMLDSETALDAQAAWLSETLAEGEADFAAALVFMHRPPFTNTSVHGAVGGDPNLQGTIVPVLEASPLPVAAFMGHVHGYEHLQLRGIDYVITAGGGGPRGYLAPERSGDVYPGPDCATNEEGGVLRPFNYVLVERETDAVGVTVRGFCTLGETPVTLERFSLRLD
jgi:Calcineurin-like phosphoesterase